MSTPTPSGIAAVVFDLDGILVETEAWWDEVRRDLAAAEGRTWPEGATRAMMGMSTPEWSRYLAEEIGIPGTPPEVADRVIDAMAARYVDDLPTLPGAREAVRRMAEARPVGVASSSPRRLIDTVASALGIDDVLGATVSTEEVQRGKPAPDGYLRACELLGVDPAASVAVEDSANGLCSALDAGMLVIAVPPAFHPPTQDVLDRVHAVIGTLDELTEDLLAGLRR